IATVVHRRGAGMVCAAFHIDAEPDRRCDGGDNADRTVRSLESASLLDVELQAVRDSTRRIATWATTLGRERGYDGGGWVSERDEVVESPLGGEQQAPDPAWRETNGLLAAPDDDLERPLGQRVRGAHRFDRLDRCDDAECAVVAASVRHRVDM